MILAWALHLLIGCGLGVHHNLLWLIPLFALQWLFPKRLQGLVFCCLGIALTLFYSPFLSKKPLLGKGIFLLKSIAPFQTPFQHAIAMRGKLTTFSSEGKDIRNIPCTIFVKDLPPISSKYYIEGILKDGQLKLGKRPPMPLDNRISLPHTRFQLKNWIRKICYRIQDQKVGYFFASILTGDTEDYLLAMEFRKWGLSHILAISGLHFGLIAIGFGIFIRLFLPTYLNEIALIGTLTIAFLYFGPSASITRSYVMITVYLAGRKQLRSIEPLNLLATALVLELLCDPRHVSEIGFQLSYSATFGILAFFSHAERILEYIFPKRDRETLKNWNLLNQHGYLVAAFLRKAIALNVAVHLTTLPILLYHFKSFPLLSPIFNLFIPPLLVFSILSLFLGPINHIFTRCVLDVCAYTPERFNLQWRLEDFPFALAICLVTLIGTLGLTATGKIRKNGAFSCSGDRSSVG